MFYAFPSNTLLELNCVQKDRTGGFATDLDAISRNIFHWSQTSDVKRKM